MADLEQWVNVTRHTKWFGDGLLDVKRMTETVKVTIQFDQRARATGFLSVVAASTNADYSATEIPRRNAIFTLPDFNMRQFQTDETGKYEIDINVGSAGGNEYAFTVKDGSGNELRSDVIKTRRKLYFQVIRMSDVTAPSAANITGMKNQFWNPTKRIYLKMVEYAAGRTIATRVNYDMSLTSVVNSVKRQARRVYNNSKAPNAFVAVFVNKIGPSALEVRAVSATIGAGNFTLNTLKTLMDIVDPAVDYYISIVWISGTSVQIVTKAKITRSGNKAMVIDTTGLTRGAGTILYSVMVCTGPLGGLSYGGSNFTVIGTRFTTPLVGRPLPSALVMGILVHEIGHKIGMVPGTQSDRVLDVQTATHYTGRDHQGNHCAHGVPKPFPPSFNSARGISPDCTMFGNASTVSTSVFCTECQKSLRKLDLRGSNNIGLRQQF